MMIKRISYCGIPFLEDNSIEFNSDINIITGKNGCGKTTLLKLIWLTMSLRIDLLVNEIPFSAINLETDVYNIKISNVDDNFQKSSYNIRISTPDKKNTWQNFFPKDELSRIYNVLPAHIGILIFQTQTVFFPTFRRIEGGFSIKLSNQSALALATSPAFSYLSQSEMQSSLKNLSTSLTTGGHKFVCSISTEDLVDLVTEKFGRASKDINEEYSNLSKKIIEIVDQYNREDKYKFVPKMEKDKHSASYAKVVSLLEDKLQGGIDLEKFLSNSHSLTEAQKTIEEIKKIVKKVTNKRDKMFEPFIALHNIVIKFFSSKGIEMSPTLFFGNENNKIDSSKLSSGEKQLLSFLCYNIFTNRGVVFIDEPELSLHVDWQRLLITTLLKQNTGNQFILATHSPFIYSKYHDKEILLAKDRGN